jgi:transcriptional regulator with XRE-family HTH domain
VEVIMMTGEQARAARAMLGLEQTELAEKAGVSVKTIKRFESMTGRIDGHSVYSVKNALELGGIEFLDGEDLRGRGEGIRFRTDRTAKLRRKIVEDVERHLDVSLQLAVEKDQDLFERPMKEIAKVILKDLNEGLHASLQSNLKKDD